MRSCERAAANPPSGAERLPQASANAPNPALESVAYSNYKAGATIDPAVFTLPDVCHQGTANRYHGGGARQALDLLLRR